MFLQVRINFYEIFTFLITYTAAFSPPFLSTYVTPQKREAAQFDQHEISKGNSPQKKEKIPDTTQVLQK